jgi:hypothetical protein
MALANFQKAISEIVGRAGNMFVLDTVPATDAWTHLGIVKGLKVTATPLVTERDTTGREFQYGYDVRVECSLMQSAYSRAADFSSLLDDSGNGITVKITDRPAAEANLGSATGADSAAGIRFNNTIFTVEPVWDYASAESTVNLKFGGHVPKDAFDSFGATGGTLTFDA